MPLAHLRIVIVRTLRSDSHRVEHVSRELMSLSIQMASRVSEVLVIVIVRTLRSDSHMVDHVPRGLM